MRSRLVVVAFLVVACGSHHADTQAPTTTASNAPSNQLPPGPPLVTPGERMQYKLALQGMELATYDFGVGDLTEVGGKKAIIVQSHAKAQGLVKMVTNLDDYFTSYVDIATGRPLRFDTDEYATRGNDKERTDVRFFERADNLVPVDFHLNDDKPAPEPQKVSMPDVWDYNAFLVALRSWEGPPGTTAIIEVFRSRYMWHLTVKIGGKEKLVTELGELPALRFDGHIYKLSRDGTRFPDTDERDFSVWISDDDGRVPLQTTARTDYGDIKMTILDYQPGTGKRLRN